MHILYNENEGKSHHDVVINRTIKLEKEMISSLEAELNNSKSKADGAAEKPVSNEAKVDEIEKIEKEVVEIMERVNKVEKAKKVLKPVAKEVKVEKIEKIEKIEKEVKVEKIETPQRKVEVIKRSEDEWKGGKAVQQRKPKEKPVVEQKNDKKAKNMYAHLHEEEKSSSSNVVVVPPIQDYIGKAKKLQKPKKPKVDLEEHSRSWIEGKEVFVGVAGFILIAILCLLVYIENKYY